MFLPDSSKSEDVEHLLRNAQLRDELEPLFDEAIDRVNPSVMTTRSENEFLESMLEWERAPGGGDKHGSLHSTGSVEPARSDRLVPAWKAGGMPSVKPMSRPK